MRQLLRNTDTNNKQTIMTLIVVITITMCILCWMGIKAYDEGPTITQQMVGIQFVLIGSVCGSAIMTLMIGYLLLIHLSKIHEEHSRQLNTLHKELLKELRENTEYSRIQKLLLERATKTKHKSTNQPPPDPKKH